MRYFDFNATAPLLPEVAQLIVTRAKEFTANPSSVHQAGRAARARLQASRETVARLLGAELREICFTAGGSESSALALKGLWRGRSDPLRTTVVSSSIEHPCVLESLKQLEREGAVVVRLSPDSHGQVPLERLEHALTAKVALCSLMWANNETGVLQPVAEAARLCRERGIAFHTDAVQAVGKVPVSLQRVHADALSLSAHKFGGPQGAGVLVARRALNLEALVPGHQEDGRRGGTQAVTQIEALALAMKLSVAAVDAEAQRQAALRDRFEQAVLAALSGVTINGAGVARTPNTSNLQFEGADGEALLIALDLDGFAASSGAACASGSLKPSHVLTAMGLTAAQTHGSLRFSLGKDTTEADVDALAAALRRHVPSCRG